MLADGTEIDILEGGIGRPGRGFFEPCEIPLCTQDIELQIPNSAKDQVESRDDLEIRVSLGVAERLYPNQEHPDRVDERRSVTIATAPTSALVCLLYTSPSPRDS